MSDGDHLREAWKKRMWGRLAAIIAANVVMVASLIGIALLLLLAGIHGLDWLGVLPCLCV